MKTDKIKKYIDSGNAYKPGFWVFHIAGWLAFSIIDFVQNFQQVIQFSGGWTFRWFLIMLSGFTVTLILRYWYRLIYTKRFSIYLISVIIVFSSFIGAILWGLTIDLLIHPLQSVLFNQHEFPQTYNGIFNLIRRLCKSKGIRRHTTITAFQTI